MSGRSGHSSGDPQKTARHAAALIESARRSRRWLRRLPGEFRPNSFEQAYDIQDVGAAEFDHVCAGWKVGCTSSATQQLLGCSEPIAGRLFEETVLTSPATLRALRDDMPFVEAEIAFRLSRDLPSRANGYSLADIRSAVGSVIPAVEIVQSRFADWREVSLPETIADMAGHGALVLGREATEMNLDRLRSLDIRVLANGSEIARGTGAAVLGDPLNALLWLANFASRRGCGLHRGEVVASGTCTGMSVVEAGASLVAEFAGLGSVELQFPQ